MAVGIATKRERERESEVDSCPSTAERNYLWPSRRMAIDTRRRAGAGRRTAKPKSTRKSRSISSLLRFAYRRPDQTGDEPRAADHDRRSFRRSLRAVGQRTRDRQVAIETDQKKIGDRGVGHGVIHAEPDVAQEGVEGPAIFLEEGEEDGHGEATDGEISDGK